MQASNMTQPRQQSSNGSPDPQPQNSTGDETTNKWWERHSTTFGRHYLGRTFNLIARKERAILDIEQTFVRVITI